MSNLVSKIDEFAGAVGRDVRSLRADVDAVDVNRIDVLERRLSGFLWQSRSGVAASGQAALADVVDDRALAPATLDIAPQFGVDAKTGRLLSGVEHLEQSIADIILTPRGSRVMRRDYGSDLYLLKDKQMNPSNIVKLYSAVAVALDRWEPRVVLDRVWVDGHDANDGFLAIGLGWHVAKAYRESFRETANDDFYQTQRVVA